MCIGTVPVYLPMPGAEGEIPPDTFINLGMFKDLSEHIDHFVEISGTGVVDQYRERGWQFVNSDDFAPFTFRAFAGSVEEAVVRARG